MEADVKGRQDHSTTGQYGALQDEVQARWYFRQAEVQNRRPWGSSIGERICG
jgi:hypothetical protein